MPLTVNTALLNRWPAVRLVMLKVGLLVSIKLACNTRLLCITNCKVAPFVSTASGNVMPPVQLVNETAPAVAVIEYVAQICSDTPL